MEGIVGEMNVASGGGQVGGSGGRPFSGTRFLFLNRFRSERHERPERIFYFVPRNFPLERHSLHCRCNST